MCGICGFAGPGGRADLERMNGMLSHRGPDDQGYWHDAGAGVFLGHKRLAVTDVAGGAQPMSTSDGGLVVVCNGEIYNHPELRAELEVMGHIFSTSHSDAEVLLHGFRQWGEELPLRLNGMWAFAIYDVRNKKLFLSRDRFGQKPLFYTAVNGLFAFASELTSLLAHKALSPSVSRLALKKYFAYGYIPAPHSLCKGVRKLPGGCNLVLGPEKDLKKRRYWEFKLEPFDRIPKNPIAQWGGEILELLDRSVARQLASDAPVGVFLSGGVDSSSIMTLAARGSLTGCPPAFSVRFDEPSFNESTYSRKVAGLFGAPYHEFKFPMEKIPDMLASIGARLDEPIADSSLLPMYLLCQEAKKHVTVALSGDGGDELFAGYDPFKVLRLADLYSKIVPRPVHNAIRLLAARTPVSHRNISIDFKIKRTLKGLSYPARLWNPIWMGPLSPAELSELFMEPTDLEEVYEEAIDCWESCGQANLVDRTMQFFTSMYFQNDILVKSDRMGMMNSLEIRTPFLDLELVDLVRKIPHQYKYRAGRTKFILKKSLKNLLPHHIIHRPKKGFGAPLGQLFEKGILQPPQLRISDSRFVEKACKEHMSGKCDHSMFLLSAWVLAFSKVYSGC